VRTSSTHDGRHEEEHVEVSAEGEGSAARLRGLAWKTFALVVGATAVFDFGVTAKQ
jgi:hypothetical protein